MKTTKESKMDRFIEVSEYVGIAIFSVFMAFGLLFQKPEGKRNKSNYKITKQYENDDNQNLQERN